jgi:DNA-binding response OmpR family regulator
MTTQSEPGFFYVLDDDLSILFVDDDPILREFALVHLNSGKTRIETADDGEAALKMLGQFSPDIILADLEMPGIDGFELLARLRADPRHEHTPVIVVTGREDVKAIDRAFETGATSFIVKPINWRLLTYQIRFVERAARHERALEEARAKADADAALANERLMRIVTESSNFVRAAIRRDPELREEACRHAYALELALQPAGRVA